MATTGSGSRAPPKRRRTDEENPNSSTSTALVLHGSAPGDAAMGDANAQDMAELLFRERTRIALDLSPALISKLENRRELGYYTNPGNKSLPFRTFDLNVVELRRCITQVLYSSLRVRYYDRSNLRNTEIAIEMNRIIPLTVSACMCAIYAKLRSIHRQHGRLSQRYTTPPHYNKEIELPLPLAVAIQELGMFQTTSLVQNEIYAPTYPEATPYEGRITDVFNITDYVAYIPTFKDLGIPCKSVDTNIKKGSAWWTYQVYNAEGTTDLLCMIPPTCYSELSASLRLLFLARQEDTYACLDIIDWPENAEDYGVHVREMHPNSNTRAFLALCHGPKEEWSYGTA